MCSLCRMPKTGRPKAVLVLTDEERETLTRWSRRAKTSQALALRCRIVLACADGLSNVEVAQRLGVTRPTVGKWRSRFVRGRLEGLVDEPRPGRPPSITVDQIEDVVVATLEETPRNATHWSRASMAQRSGLSESTIGRIWRKFDLKPHQAETFKLSTDPLFVEKLFDVVGLYFNPPDGAVVLCADEKSQIQALDRSQPVLPMMPGMPERRTHDYVRNGITTLFAAFDTRTGEVISSILCKKSLPTRRPRACTYPVSSCRITDWRNDRNSAATTTPRIDPRPPSTTMTRIMTDTGNVNMSGVAVVSLAT